MIQEGEGHWPNSSESLQKARNLWVLRTPQNNKEEGARAKKLMTCGTRGPLGRGQSVPFSAQGAYCSAPEPQDALTEQELLPRPRSGSEKKSPPLKNINVSLLIPALRGLSQKIYKQQHASGPLVALRSLPIIELNPYIFHQTPRTLVVVVLEKFGYSFLNERN